MYFGERQTKDSLTNQSIQEMLQELQRLKGAGPAPSPTIPHRTVFSDISDEWANCSNEEREFVSNDAAYVQADLKYQQDFNSFLLDALGAQFLQTPYGKSAEDMLIALRAARQQYKNNSTAVMTSMQMENQTLKRELDDLKRLIGEKNNVNK